MDEPYENDENDEDKNAKNPEATLRKAETAVAKFNTDLSKRLRSFIDELTAEEHRLKKSKETTSDVASDAHVTPAFRFDRSKK
jgi:hypothetical protein